MRYLIGVDDTDNLESRGTGFRARCLGVDLAMTTNAILLDKMAGPLAEAGLKRVNVSIDTIVFRQVDT